jgi:N-acetylglucosamine-1-phosphodiester alpha-N-acetylglucosaminidase
MNAGYFGVHSGQCLGTLVVNGHVLQVSNNTNAVFGIRQDGTLVTGYIPNEEIINTSNPFVHLVSGVIWLVRKGLSYVDESAKAESSDNEGTGTMNQFIDVVSARTAIGHDRQGRIVFVHIEGQTDLRGMNLHDFARLLVKLGLVNAINMDGGGSATMVENGTLISYPTDHCHNPSFRCMREVSTIVCIHPPVCKYPICSGHGECQLGICKCNKPWTGEGCQLLNCSIMKCNGRGICANTSSQCNCTKPGYTGPLCDKVCPQGFYGPGCNNKCSCYHFSRCNPENGSCTCKAGWRGKSCNKRMFVYHYFSFLFIYYLYK